MASLRVTLKAPVTQEVVPGEFSVEATISNESSEPATLNLTQASWPSLSLEIQDSRGQRILMAPPPVPNEKDLGPGETIAPKQSVQIRYAGFLDRSLAAGKYRLRYFSYHSALGGSKDEPLQSDWLDFSVRKMEGFPVAKPLKLALKAPIHKRFFLIDWCWRFWHWLICLILRIFFRKRCNRVLEREVDEARTETISNAPPNASAWNGTYGWRARFHVRVDEASCHVTVTVRVRLVGTITQTQQSAWESAIESAWSNVFKLCCRCCCCPDGYQIITDIQFVTSGEHQDVNVGASTTNMGNWGANDTVGVRHEFGHMLGALDEYFTVNGVNYGAPWQANGNIMNNPANGPAAHHYDLSRAAVEDLLSSNCTTRAVSESC